MATLQEGQIGAFIRVKFRQDGQPVDISSSVTRKIILKKPNRVVVTKTATLFGTDELRYTTVANDLVPAGTWQAQAETDITGKTSWGTFPVNKNL